MDKLRVNIDSNLAGELIKENDEFIFAYETEDANDFISLGMQVRHKPFIYNKLHPIFEMHLPEGYLLSMIKKHFSKLIKTDDFGLLKVMAPSIKGRVSYQTTSGDIGSDLSLDDLLHPQSDTLFDELVSRFALYSALSGVQPKVLARVEDKATLKIDDYIVKSWGAEYKELALNEYYCMQIVKLAGIEVPEFYLSEDEKLFIMKRFDKVDDTYIGFEDMCVLMGKQRDDKYEGTYEQVAKTIKTFVSPQHKKTSLMHFFKLLIINYSIKNGDAHLKNFGLLYSGVKDIRLAPAYDVVCTTAYISHDIPALLMLGSKKWWDSKYLIQFGIQACDLTQKEVDTAMQECVDAMSKIKAEIDTRLKSEENEDKREILQKLVQSMGFES